MAALINGHTPTLFTLTPEFHAALNQSVQDRKDAEFAARIRTWRPDAVAEQDDAALTEQVGVYRRIAASFGVTDPALKARWVMIGAVLAPEFWKSEAIYPLLVAKTGTPDIRFGDVCAALKVSLGMVGRSSEVWW